MFAWLGRKITRRPKTVMLCWFLIMAFAAFAAFAGFGDGGLFSRMSSSMSLVPGSESDKVMNLVQGENTPESTTVVVTGVSTQTDYPKLAQFAAKWRSEFLTVPHVAGVIDPFQSADPKDPKSLALLSSKGDGFITRITLESNLDKQTEESALDAVTAKVDKYRTELSETFPGATANASSTQIVARSLIDQVRKDLYTGEAISLPLSLLLMVIIFGGLIVAGMPLISALVTIVTTLGILLGITYLIDVQSYILNVISLIGIALSIDYGLLMVSRYREETQRLLVENQITNPAELDKTSSKQITNQALVASVRTAGRTVSFSALTIAFAISSLLVMKAPIIKVIAVGSVVTVILSVLTAITFVPALLAVAGRKLLKPSPVTKIFVLRRLVKAVGDTSSDEGVFSKLARYVHRHPWPIMVVIFAMLITLTTPLGNAQVRAVFSDYIPKNSSTWATWETIQNDYPALAEHTATVVALTDQPIDQLREHISTLEHVTALTDPMPLPDGKTGVYFDVISDIEDHAGKEATHLVNQIQQYTPHTPSGESYEMLVGGVASLQQDFIKSLAQGAVPAAAIAIAAVLILLFLMTGSVIVPLKALIINTLSWVASLGTTVFIFKHGLGVPTQNGITAFVMACGLAFGFGLAMDYEVFLLARIKEEWDAGRANDEAVERGLQRSGRIITSAAVIIIAVFVGFVFGEMMAVKEIGVLLAITVALDATLVRMLLVPATMTVLGKWNWWAPKPLRKLHQKIGIND